MRLSGASAYPLVMNVGGASEDQRQIESQQQQAEAVGCGGGRAPDCDPAFYCWIHALLLPDVFGKHRNVHITCKREEPEHKKAERHWDCNICTAAELMSHLTLDFWIFGFLVIEYHIFSGKSIPPKLLL